MSKEIRNLGNNITRRIWADTDRMKQFRALLNCSWSAAYSYVEEMEYGSGTPSPLHNLCEQIRLTLELDREGNTATPAVHELANYPIRFLSELLSESKSAEADVHFHLNTMLERASKSITSLNGHDLCGMTRTERQALSALLGEVGSAALMAQMIVDSGLEEEAKGLAGSSSSKGS